MTEIRQLIIWLKVFFKALQAKERGNTTYFPPNKKPKKQNWHNYSLLLYTKRRQHEQQNLFN